MFTVDTHGSSNPFNGGNVTFRVDNGATLAPFDPSFLLTAPAPSSTSNPGITTLVVPSTQMIQQGSKFYALALVTAGVPSTTSVLSNIQVSVLDGNLKPVISPQDLSALPVPIVLIHGLWGNQYSLKSTQKYLQSLPAFSAYNGVPAYFIRPICYSPYLAYYAKRDSLPNNGISCEQTSTDALYNSLRELHELLNQDRIVGGRVDVVAHSMGGLVVRNYTVSAPNFYRNATNRNQGAFRDIITLDTPETGSALAYYLDYVLANKTEDITQFADATWPDTVWSSLCGLKAGITVQDCLTKLGNPLAYPGRPLTEGAVYSLIPDGPPLFLNRFANIPSPNIPNATWFAVAGSWLDDGHHPSPMARDTLDPLVAATYSTSETPLTLSGMLGDIDNDVIVTRASQLSEAIPGQFHVYMDLAHTSIPYAGPIFSLGGLNPLVSNATVTNSTDVNRQVVHWLGY